MSPTFTSDDVGKAVETAAGDRIGVVADVDPETAYVEPAPDAGDSTRAVLEWGGDAETVPLSDDVVSERTEDAIRLEAEFAADAVTSGTDDDSGQGGAERADETASEPATGDADHAPGEPVASNPTEAPPDEPGTTPDDEIGADEAAEPMVEDDEFYDTAEDEARVDPDEEMEPPEETESAETGDRAAETTTDERDRDDVNVDPDDVIDGDPEAEIDPEEDVGRRGGPGDSSE